MTAKNDITGDKLQTKAASEEYRNNYDLIFGKDKKIAEQRERMEKKFKDRPKSPQTEDWDFPPHLD